MVVIEIMLGERRPVLEERSALSRDRPQALVHGVLLGSPGRGTAADAVVNELGSRRLQRRSDGGGRRGGHPGFPARRLEPPQRGNGHVRAARQIGLFNSEERPRRPDLFCSHDHERYISRLRAFFHSVAPVPRRRVDSAPPPPMIRRQRQGRRTTAMDFTLSEDQRAIQDMARGFARDHFAPNAAAWDRDETFPIEQLRRAGELGLGGIYVRDDVGGRGLGRLDAAIILVGQAGSGTPGC